jgi:hypothetical protein
VLSLGKEQDPARTAITTQPSEGTCPCDECRPGIANGLTVAFSGADYVFTDTREAINTPGLFGIFAAASLWMPIARNETAHKAYLSDVAVGVLVRVAVDAVGAYRAQGYGLYDLAGP